MGKGGLLREGESHPETQVRLKLELRWVRYLPTWTIHGLHAIRQPPASRAGAATEDNAVNVLLEDLKAFGMEETGWTTAAKQGGGIPWNQGVLKGAEEFMTSWHEKGDEKNHKRATDRV